VISGHFHGSGKDRSGYPAATLLANIDRINSLQASAILSTGDLFLEPEKEHQQFQRSFLSKLNAPIFNVPGNHDKGGYYDEHFGPTYSSFMIGEDAFILLDTEQKDGSLDKDQLQLLEELEQKDVRNIFILSHRPIWSEGDKRYGPLFEGNTRSVVGTNFKQAVFPLVQELAKSSPVFWISGSTAGNAPTSFFFQEHEQNIFYIQSAIRNSEWDALLVADVSADGIRWSSLSLTDRTATDPRSFNADWWWQQRGGKKPFNYRLIPYYVKSAALEPLFWYGAVVGLLLFALVRLVLRRVL
jgi:calcineurin-like phosphoesterase family protein